MNSLGPLLAQLESATLPTHLQHLRVRLSRQFAQLITSSSSSPYDQHEHLVRLNSRLEEIESELREAAAVEQDKEGDASLTEQGVVARSYLALADHTKTTREQLGREVQQYTVQPRATPGKGTPSRDQSSSPEPRPRKARPAPSSSAASTLEAFLRSKAPSTPDASPVAAHAKALSDAFTLHLLATSPSAILPAGTSLASVFRSQLHRSPSSTPTTPPKTSDAVRSLDSRVTSSLRAAYFAQAVEDLSNGAAGFDSAAASRAWKQLRQDLWDTAGGLIPARLGGGAVKRSLEAALTGQQETFDARAAAQVIKELVELLAKLCAPARDPQVQALLFSLQPQGDPSVQALVEGVAGVLELAKGMQDDLKGFRNNLAGATMDDEALEGLVRSEAAERERRAVHEATGGEAKVQQGTQVWVEGKLGERAVGWSALDDQARGALIKQAMWESLFEDHAVAVPPFRPDSPLAADTAPPTPANALPPILAVLAPRLFALQNTLQALVILACLQHLAPPAALLSTSTSLVAVAPSEDTLGDRLWTILSATSASNTAPEDWTHLAHLSDEITAAWTKHHSSTTSTPSSPDPSAEATRIRTSVERILRYEDPVYRLLKGRLREGLKGVPVGASADQEESAMPASMRSGRVAGTGSAARSRAERKKEIRILVSVIKGFERPGLREKVEEAAREGGEVLRWAQAVWGAEVGFIVS